MAIKFGITFGLLLAVFYAIYIPVSQSSAYRGYLVFIADSVCAGLRLLGQEVRVEGRCVVGPINSLKIVPGCDGMEVLALFGSAVLASPVPWLSRLAFLALGTLSLMVFNVFRIVSIFLIGIRHPEAAETIHWDVWPGILIVAVLVCWLLWARWAVTRQLASTAESST